MKKTFESYRATNPRLHNILDQQDQYNRYLKRVEKIVDKKPSQDTTPTFYMNFMHKTKYINRSHRNLQQESIIGLENQHLLDKIVQAKNRKSQKSVQNYALALYQKRYRQQQKINQQNKQIAKRINQQYSILRKKKFNKLNKQDKPVNLSSSSNQSLEKSKSNNSWHNPLKSRKLPKLVTPIRS